MIDNCVNIPVKE